VGNVYLNAPGSAVVTIADNDPGVSFSAAATRLEKVWLHNHR
jgi:hypothetical protein